MTQEEKLELVKKFFDNKGIKYRVPKKEDYLCDVYAYGKYKISVHVSNNRDKDFFKKYNYRYPVYIREEETIDFILEKLENVISRIEAKKKKIEEQKEKKIKNIEQNRLNWERHLEKLRLKAKSTKKKRARIIRYEPVSICKQNG